MTKISSKIVKAPDNLDGAFEVRRKVFQEEQGIDGTLDFDGKDESSIHIVVYEDDKPVGTGRIRELEKGNAKIERVAVLSEMRGQGIGKLILEQMHTYLISNNFNSVILDSQYHAKKFYEKLGYSQKGEIFEEVGIPHIVMEKRFT